MADSLNTAALAESLGDYCRQYREVLLTTTLLGMSIRPYVTTMDGISDELVLTQMVSNKVVKPYKDDFEPTNNALELKPRTLKVRNCKVDLQLKVKQYYKTWLGLIKQPGRDPYTLPFEAYLMQRIIEQAKADIELDALFKGVYDANGDTPDDTLDGWLTILDNEYASGDIVTINPLAANNAVTEVEKLVSVVPTRFLYQPDIFLFLPAQKKRFYDLHYRSLYGALPYNQQFAKTIIDGSNIEMVAVEGMTEDKIFITTKDNMAYGTDTDSDMDNMIIEKEKRNINVMMDFAVGTEFGILDKTKIWYAKA
jgi:hypothetical protein